MHYGDGDGGTPLHPVAYVIACRTGRRSRLSHARPLARPSINMALPSPPFFDLLYGEVSFTPANLPRVDNNKPPHRIYVAFLNEIAFGGVFFCFEFLPMNFIRKSDLSLSVFLVHA